MLPLSLAPARLALSSVMPVAATFRSIASRSVLRLRSACCSEALRRQLSAKLLPAGSVSKGVLPDRSDPSSSAPKNWLREKSSGIPDVAGSNRAPGNLAWE